MDNFREVKTTSYGKRVQDSFAGVAIGFLLFLSSFGVLWWNEGRSHDRMTALSEGLAIVVPVQSSDIMPANDGKLVHFTGMSATPETLIDSDFGISLNAIHLRRTAEMYQWNEESESSTSSNMGGSETTETIYKYKKAWSSSAINSADFREPAGHTNPGTMPYEGRDYAAQSVTVGRYAVSRDFISRMSFYSDVPFTAETENALPENIKGVYKVQGGYLYKGDPANPQVGDMRIKFSAVLPGEVSIVGKQTGMRAEPYLAATGAIALLEQGARSADLMFAAAQEENNLITWLVRGGGFLMMWVGLGLVLGPLSVIGSVVPFIGAVAGAGVGLVTGLFSVALSVLTIAAAWLFTRPLVALGLVVIAGACVFGAISLLRRRKAA